MKKATQLMAFAAAITLTSGLIFSSCKKDKTGPAGPAGPAGANGVANIQTGTVTTNNASWSFSSADNSYNATLTFAGITQSVVDKGTVQVFIGDGTGQEWAALPFSYNIIQYNYSFKNGQVIISVTLSNGAVPNNPGGQQFKVVVIPPARVIPNVNMNNYADVKAAYNLVD